jgi:hypothetical protein
MVDYRKLNKYMESDVMPLPHIQTIIKKMSKMKLFTKFDVQEGYHNIQVVPEDWWKIAFKTLRGLFEFNIMSFGLCNALATFSQFIVWVVAPLHKKYPKNFTHYMDDLLIGTDEGEEALHQKIVHELLELLEQQSLFLKPLKCIFKQKEVDFLGVHLGNEVATIKPSKIAGIKDWPEEVHSVKQVQQALGILSFQQPFIPNFASIA